MTKRLNVFALAAFAAGSILVASPRDVAAQGKGKGHEKPSHEQKKDVKEHGREDVKEHGREDARTTTVVTRRMDEHRGRNDDVANNSKGKGGPSFCRSGAGHPVYGRSWCVDKGFGLGTTRWGNAGWGDVVLGRTTTRTGTVSSGTLSDVLGRVIFGRLQTQSNGGALTGNWVTSSAGPLILQVNSGGRPIAEFVDRNRDGRAEVVMLNLTH